MVVTSVGSLWKKRSLSRSLATTVEKSSTLREVLSTTWRQLIWRYIFALCLTHILQRLFLGDCWVSNMLQNIPKARSPRWKFLGRITYVFQVFMMFFLFSGHMTIHKPKTACDFCGKLVSRMKEHLETMHKDDNEMNFRCMLGTKIFYKNLFGWIVVFLPNVMQWVSGVTTVARASPPTISWETIIWMFISNSDLTLAGSSILKWYLTLYLILYFQNSCEGLVVIKVTTTKAMVQSIRIDRAYDAV